MINRTLFLSLAFAMITVVATAQETDKAASKKDASAVANNFDKFKEESTSSWGSPKRYISAEELVHYKMLLEHIKNSDSLTVSKLQDPADKFYILAARRTSNPRVIWAMDEKDLVISGFLGAIDNSIYLKDITIGTEVSLSASSTKKSKIFKADLLYKNVVFEKNAVVCIKDDDEFYFPTVSFRSLYFKNLVTPDMQKSGQTEDAFVMALAKKVRSKGEYGSMWYPKRSVAYWTNNKLRSSNAYQNGMLEGTSREYDGEGNMTLKTEYKLGKKNGIQLRYQNNKLESERLYADDILIGNGKEYHANGKLKALLVFTNGEREISTYYDSTGNVEEVTKSTVSGTYSKRYYPGNILKQEGHFGNFGAVGNWKSYDTNGILSGEQEYALGMKSGKGKDFNPNGTVKTEYIYLLGNLQTKKDL